VRKHASDSSRLALSGATTRHFASITMTDYSLFQELRLDLSMAQSAMTQLKSA